MCLFLWWCMNASFGCPQSVTSTEKSDINSSCFCSLTAGQSVLQQCGNLGEVISPPLLVLMSACLRRAPWKRSVGSCWTAKGASSGEVRPLFILLLLNRRRPVSAHGSTRQDSEQAGRQTGGTLPSCLLSTCYSRKRPHFLAHLNANTL